VKYRISATKVLTCDKKKLNGKYYIEIENGVITKIGSLSDLSVKEQDECYHYENCTILPGLINAHEHLATKSQYTPWTLPEIKAESIPMQTLRDSKNAKGLLYDGITTIRECGGRDHININISKAVQRGFIVGPDILACGRPISIMGGHVSYYSWQINGKYEAINAVRREIMAGADFIKVHATGGAGTLEGDPKYAELTLEELKTIVNEAHRANKRVASHAIGRLGIENSLKAGVDSIEHGHYLDEPLLEIMAKNGIFYVPTLTGYIPLAKRGLEMGRPVWMVEKAKKLLDKHQEVMAMLKKYPEIVIAAGTDSSGEMWEELDEIVKVGYTPYEAIIFATKNAATVLGILDSVGTISEGKKANIIIVEGDPENKITDLRNLKEIIKSGKMLLNSQSTIKLH